MFIAIDPSSGVPIYLQIVNQVKRDIALGRLQPEQALPSVRQLAVELTINPNTVARAYLDLEHEGVIYKRAGQGTFVSARGVEMSRRERLRIFKELLERALVEGANLQLTEHEMRDAFDALLQAIQSSERSRRK